MTLLTRTYRDYAVADSAVSAAVSRSGSDPSSTTARAEDDGGSITITARARSATAAASLANELGRSVVRRSRGDRLLSALRVARAVTPSSPTAPPRRRLEAAGVAAGLLLSVGLFLLIDRVAPRFRSWREVTPATGLGVIGRIPPGADVASDRDVASAFRSLRAVLAPKLQASDAAVLVVSAASRGEGCMTVAAGLADSFARRVRRPFPTRCTAAGWSA